jgi:hypothetical protein
VESRVSVAILSGYHKIQEGTLKNENLDETVRVSWKGGSQGEEWGKGKEAECNSKEEKQTKLWVGKEMRVKEWEVMLANRNVSSKRPLKWFGVLFFCLVTYCISFLSLSYPF